MSVPFAGRRSPAPTLPTRSLGIEPKPVQMLPTRPLGIEPKPMQMLPTRWLR